MTTQDVQTETIQLLEGYIQALERYSLEAFHKKPQPHTWSLAEMYEHLTTSTQFFFMNAEKCLDPAKSSESGEKSAEGEQILKNHSYPNRKLQPPDKYKAGVANIQTREKDLYPGIFRELINYTNQLTEKIAMDKEHRKREHASFGMLDAAEWFEAGMLHLRHHLLQKKELEALATAH